MNANGKEGPFNLSSYLQGGTQQVGKQASKPSLALPSLRGKAQQAGKSLKGGAKQASKQAPKPTFSLPSLSGKALQVGKTAKIKAGAAPQKAKKAVSNATGTGFFGTGSTRGKSAPAKQGSNLGTRSTRPGDLTLCLLTTANVYACPHMHGRLCVIDLLSCWECWTLGRSTLYVRLTECFVGRPITARIEIITQKNKRLNQGRS